MHEFKCFHSDLNIYSLKFIGDTGREDFLAGLGELFGQVDFSRHLGLIVDLNDAIANVSTQNMLTISDQVQSNLPNDIILHSALVASREHNLILAQTYLAVRKSSSHEIINVFEDLNEGIQWLKSELSFYQN